MEAAEQASFVSIYHNNEAQQWAILLTESLLQVVFCHNAVSVNFKYDIRGSKFTLFYYRNTKACSELVVLEVIRVSFPCPMLSVLTSGRTLTIKPADVSENTVGFACSFV